MTEPSGPPTIRRFGVFEFEPAAGELRKNGIRIKLHGQPNDILAMLLDRPGQVVTRDEIQKKLWPKDFVDFEHSLNAAVKRLRDALDASAVAPRYIETLPRRGYRFISPVDGHGASDSVPKPLIDTANKAAPGSGLQLHSGSKAFTYFVVAGGITLLIAAAAFLSYRESPPPRG